MSWLNRIRNLDRRRVAHYVALVATVALMGSRSNCTNQPATLTCTNINVTALRGTCTSFTNPCADNQWVLGDNFELNTAPPGVTLATVTSPSIERSICTDASARVLVNQAVDITYSRSGEYGNGIILVTTGVPLSVSPSATGCCGSFQLNAGATGGTPPYSYSWSPAAGLTNEHSGNPIATVTTSTTYTVTVSDADGTIVTASITVGNLLGLMVTASPVRIDVGHSAQLNAVTTGGTAPFTIAWTPDPSLSATNIPNPLASPTVTTTYTVTVTDAKGATSFATVTVFVNLKVTVSADPPAVLLGSSSQLTAVAAGGTPPYTYAWGPSTGLSATDILNPIATPQATTTYGVSVRDATGTVAFGSTTVTLTGPTGPLMMISLPESTIGKNLQTSGAVVLPAAAPSGGITVTLTSSDSTRVVLSTSGTTLGTGSVNLPIAGGFQGTGPVFVQALDSTGQVILTATAPGFSNSAVTVALAPSGFGFITPTFTSTTLLLDTLVELQAGWLNAMSTIGNHQPLRGGIVNLTVAVNSSTPSVGIITSSAVFNGGSLRPTTFAVFHPVAAGQTNLTIVQPTNFSTPSSGQQITAIVSP